MKNQVLRVKSKSGPSEAPIIYDAGNILSAHEKEREEFMKLWKSKLDDRMRKQELLLDKLEQERTNLHNNAVEREARRILKAAQDLQAKKVIDAKLAREEERYIFIEMFFDLLDYNIVLIHFAYAASFSNL